MTDLVDEVKASFETSREDVAPDTPGGTVITTYGDELAPGFKAMRSCYEEKLLMIMRRGYRQFAGSNLPTDGDELIKLTATYLQAPVIAVSIAAFTDGVMLGHRTDHMVKMCFHFNNVEHLFHDDGFRDSSMRMAHGFATDHAVCDYFNTYIDGAMSHMAHVTGFAHSEVKPHKIWDLWILGGTACVTAGYLAGNKLGATWRERDVLDGIEIASESARQDGPDQRADEGDQGELGSQ
jgi:hypothetical protein